MLQGFGASCREEGSDSLRIYIYIFRKKIFIYKSRELYIYKKKILCFLSERGVTGSLGWFINTHILWLLFMRKNNTSQREFCVYQNREHFAVADHKSSTTIMGTFCFFFSYLFGFSCSVLGFLSLLLGIPFILCNSTSK